MISVFCCPVCGGALEKQEHIYKCIGAHCFDIARQGYVNLRIDQSSGAKRHGDDKLMVNARSRFLRTGAYLPLANALGTAANRWYDANTCVLCDIGCGEGYYTEIVADALKCSGKDVTVAGIDISKDALKAAAKYINGEFAVASAFDLPLKDGSVDIIMNIFAPYSPDEFSRVLTHGGTVIRAFARRGHLEQLKAAVYDTVKYDEVDDYSLSGFRLVDRADLDYSITLHGDEINDLFMMTPYYYKSSKLSQNRAKNLTELTTNVSFSVCVYKK